MYEYRDCKKCKKNIENWICPMIAMMEEDEDDRDLEGLYPEIYHAFLPMIRKHCDKMEGKHGEMHMPSREEIEDILEDILNEMDHDANKMKSRDMDEVMLRQYPDRRLLRDLLGIIFVDELRGRRRRRRRRGRPIPPYGRPGYYPGYPGYPGFPGYPPRPGY